MTKQHFGGSWTIEKLNILSDYLDFYAKALSNQPFNIIYIDAFAGTGSIYIRDEVESEKKIEGSAKLALQAEHKFHKYIFIEKKKQFAEELAFFIKTEHPELDSRVSILNKDCNFSLIDLCKKTDWNKNRALLFLDPYATEVNWETLTMISQTRAIDVWYLFPFSAVNRLLTKNGQMDPSWRTKLTTIFGDESWFDELYITDTQLSLFDNTQDQYIKDPNPKGLENYIIKRLKTIFPWVTENPRILNNSKNSPLFVFCFAVSNKSKKAIDLARRGANCILNFSEKGKLL